MQWLTEGDMIECPAPHRKYPERVCGGNLARVPPNTFVWVREHNGIDVAGCICPKCRYCKAILQVRVSTAVA